MAEPSIAEALARARSLLLDHWSERGAFAGLLSSSSLSTATAAMAFELSAQAAADRDAHAQLAADGRAWLVANQNDDGGWGDTTDSPTNISTTTLCWASLGLDPDPPDAAREAMARAETWLTEVCGNLEPESLARTIRARYGVDHTFSVPILTTCALGGRLGTGRDAWRLVPQLPFELAACPQQWFAWLNLRTVSYALPALIAIGQVRHHHRPTRNPVARLARAATGARALRILRRIQPASGGYLEAAPLTSFVSMSLIGMGLDAHPVVESGLGFLADTVRDEGSWPIDTNLDTWVTSLSIAALDGELGGENDARLLATRQWLLGQQYREVHPYTNADPGGWAWTDLPGGVPDADDTPGALLALRHLSPGHDPGADAELCDAARRGIGWLLDLRNRDGGIPTFCRGWGKLPFDRSSPDLTAHAMRALEAWRNDLPDLQPRIDVALDGAALYLINTQREDGAWVPLWFGNQSEANEENPLYGTSRVARAIARVGCSADLAASWIDAGHRALRWILAAQHDDGGFGAAPGVPASIEETALAIEALADWAIARGDDLDGALRPPIERGAAWLAEHTERGTSFPTAPIGLYFAKLWYFEKLYPVAFTVSALRLAVRYFSGNPVSRSRAAPA